MAELVLVDYEPGWPSQFAAVASELGAAFEGESVQIEHIGSTAVPGLCAKPVLDLLLGAQALAVIEDRLPALARRGFVYRPEHETALPERRYFVRAAQALPPFARVHLHAVVVNSRIWRQHIAFRNALRASPALLLQYAELKRALAAAHCHDKLAYTDAKAPFVTRVLAAQAAPAPARRCRAGKTDSPR